MPLQDISVAIFPIFLVISQRSGLEKKPIDDIVNFAYPLKKLKRVPCKPAPAYKTDTCVKYMLSITISFICISVSWR